MQPGYCGTRGPGGSIFEGVVSVADTKGMLSRCCYQPVRERDGDDGVLVCSRCDRVCETVALAHAADGPRVGMPDAGKDR